ncbi:NAD(P)H:quinone oxidoreductase [Phytohabitans sp. ZYX-F-186]|uniref:NAD(P)H:quinone oxidoreductase n=1 Tax=Phytohabitans maris TaxID=3071409 RepID=A0ABU0ZA07_9ACTN|nr:NAD(P)H:quinone oxidoreductase [Phytohabitans sp. ZYX-F-186]MDQ7903869.1 NAD(P)H:quinone oxidoreductase [Phytohabitans sp. ZYX-F-186]
MPNDVNIAVIYYSATGNVHRLAEAVAEGAVKAGAHVRVHRVPELAPDTAIDANPDWRAHVDETREVVPEARLDDLAWADAYAFGTPTRFGMVSAQLKQFLDQAGGLWLNGVLTDKPATAFTSSINRHGGQETTLVSLYNLFAHWGSIIVPPGYTDPVLYEAGGNPYGVSWPTGQPAELPDDPTLRAAQYQGQRLADITRRLTPKEESTR